MKLGRVKANSQCSGAATWRLKGWLTSCYYSSTGDLVHPSFLQSMLFPSPFPFCLHFPSYSAAPFLSCPTTCMLSFRLLSRPPPLSKCPVCPCLLPFPIPYSSPELLSSSLPVVSSCPSTSSSPSASHCSMTLLLSFPVTCPFPSHFCLRLSSLFVSQDEWGERCRG